MKLMTLNAWQGRLERVLPKYLEEQDVDFACMQEVVAYEGMTGGLFTSFAKLGASLRLDHQYFSPLYAIRYCNDKLSFGNAVYAKMPFLQTENTFTRGAYKDNFVFGVDDYNVRAFQHVTVDVQGKRLHILNHHGHHIEAHKLGDKETMRQISIIIDYINQLDGAVILCGDFNLAPESESIKQFDPILHNLSVTYSLRTTLSVLTYKKEVCDYIFVNDKVDVKDFLMDQAIVSDHNALTLDFDIQ